MYKYVCLLGYLVELTYVCAVGCYWWDMRNAYMD